MDRYDWLPHALRITWEAGPVEAPKAAVEEESLA